MRRFILPIVFILGGVVSSPAQTVWVNGVTTLYERPDTSSRVLLTLPSGLKLTLVADNQEWLAVSTDSGMAGWVQRSTVHFSESAPTGQAQPPTGNPPPSGNPPPAGNPPPVSNPPTQANNPPPPSQQGPPAAPQQRTNTTQQPSRLVLSEGLYNAKKWFKIGVGTVNDVLMPELALGFLIADRVGLQLLGIGSRFDAGIGGSFYSAGAGLVVDVFALQPTVDLPAGVYIGGRVTGEQAFNEDLDELGATLTFGGQLGAYGHFGNTTLIIPRAELRYIKVGLYLDGEKLGDDSTTAVFLGIEARFSSIVPGLSVTLIEGESIIAGSITFAF